jgi:hypothetical protein
MWRSWCYLVIVIVAGLGWIVALWGVCGHGVVGVGLSWPRGPFARYVYATDRVLLACSSDAAVEDAFCWKEVDTCTSCYIYMSRRELGGSRRATSVGRARRLRNSAL